jgi:hypothetical protein
MAASNTRFTQNSLGQSKTPIDSDHGIYRDLANVILKNTIGNPGRTRWASSAFCDQRLFTGKLQEQGTQSATGRQKPLASRFTTRYLRAPTG